MSFVSVFLSVLELLFVSAVISIDNAVLIGVLTKDLPDKSKKFANFFGALLGLMLRLILVGVFYYILNIGGSDSVPVIYIVGGLFIVVAGLLITNKNSNPKRKAIAVGTSTIKTIFIIFSIDALLSLDNSIIVAEKGNDLSPHVTWWEITIMVFTTLISFPIILFGAKLLGEIIRKYKWIIYLASIFLISIGIGMFLEDPVLNIHLNYWVLNSIKFGGGIVLVLLKWLVFDRYKKRVN